MNQTGYVRKQPVGNETKDETIRRLEARNKLLEEAYTRYKEIRTVAHIQGEYVARIEKVEDEEGKIIEESRIESFIDEKDKDSHIIKIKSIDHGFWYENYYYANKDGKKYGEILCGIFSKDGKYKARIPITHQLMNRKKSVEMSISNIMGYMGKDTMESFVIKMIPIETEDNNKRNSP